MNTSSIEKMFGRIGARVKISAEVLRHRRAGIDISSDNRGEYFDIRVEPQEQVDYEVIDLRPEMRHLLLMARKLNSKEKFLCGHDERHWFVCAVPGSSISSVKSAMEALQPPEIRSAVRRRVKRVKNRLRRKNKAFIRQGEWFFVPVSGVTVNETLILKNEPISRGNGSKSHMCQYMYRTGGTLVWVCTKYPRGVSPERHRKLLLSVPDAKNWDWIHMRRDPRVYVCGRIWHPDHKTIILNGWHQVLMNTEWQAPGAESVVFLD